MKSWRYHGPGDPRTQSLFERMADEHGGTLEVLEWRRDSAGCTSAVVRASAAGSESEGQRFRLEVEDVVGVPEIHVLAMVQRLGRTPAGRWYPDGPPVYVSPVPSAVLAVALR